MDLSPIQEGTNLQGPSSESEGTSQGWFDVETVPPMFGKTTVLALHTVMAKVQAQMPLNTPQPPSGDPTGSDAQLRDLPL